MSFSLGQFAFTSIETDDVTITQGVQQSFQSISLEGPNEEYFQMRVFPNPVFSHLQLEFDHLKEPVTVSVFNAEGKYLFKQNISTKTARIPFHNQSGGVYILTISMSSKTLKTFKIIKKS
ncbi:MAG: T9SS type A sorting domain-containing protein [Flavobacteriales bacterium]|nr:T9SS type A sorting domain-containing protein [Flavobacteriales bacterium]